MAKKPGKQYTVIELPNDRRRVRGLYLKLFEYRSIRNHRDNYKAPEQQMTMVFFIEILDELLRDVRIVTQRTGDRIIKTYGYHPVFLRALEKAFGAVDEYCAGKRQQLPTFALDHNDPRWLEAQLRPHEFRTGNIQK